MDIYPVGTEITVPISAIICQKVEMNPFVSDDNTQAGVAAMAANADILPRRLTSSRTLLFIETYIVPKAISNSRSPISAT